MAARDVIPALALDQLCKLQLMRTTIVKFLDWKNFEEVVRGCYVRVLLEMRTEERRESSGTASDCYYVATVKGTKKGPRYTGFSWDGLETEWHIVIDLPPCFRSSPSGNVVQLNSISNTPFKQGEYQQWVQMTREARGVFLTAYQVDLRLQLLQDHLQQAHSYGTPQGRKRRQQVPEDPVKAAEREQKIGQMKTEVSEKIKSENLILPGVDVLATTSANDLQDVENMCLELLNKLRTAITERSKCRMCHETVATVICYPCKHQVLCVKCADKVEVCPAPNCGIRAQDKFESYSS